MYKDKTVAVTGGTGSFGQFITAKLLEKNVKEIRILSRDEKKQYDMKIRYRGNNSLKFMLCDIRDYLRVEECLAGVNVVFQAAALKQVYSCEENPLDAIQTNVMGVNNVIRAAIKNQVSKFVTISTDKAVKPVNVMGMTKALQERLTIAANRLPENTNTIFACVRYGNVLSSRGSIIPLFRELLRNNKKLTFTDPRMTRFLLTLGDAVKLVLYAYEHLQGGEIFVRKAPSSRILTLGEVVAEEVNKKFNYETIGIFPGEKFHEILITEEELARTEDCGEYFVVHPPWRKVKITKGIEKEYCSRDEVVTKAAVKKLVQKSDQEFRDLRIQF